MFLRRSLLGVGEKHKQTMKGRLSEQAEVPRPSPARPEPPLCGLRMPTLSANRLVNTTKATPEFPDGQH